MTRQMTVTQVKANLHALMDEIEAGDDVEITRHGVTVARLIAARGPHALKDRFAGVVKTNASDEELFSTGVDWNAQ